MNNKISVTPSAKPDITLVLIRKLVSGLSSYADLNELALFS
jgi:hypothetical protein